MLDDEMTSRSEHVRLEMLMFAVDKEGNFVK